MVEAMDVIGNASSIHQEGQKARFVVDNARRAVADMLDIRAERVVFTSGGTEGNNLALRGVMAKAPGKRVLVSAVEHDCVLETGKVLGATSLPVDANGIVRLDILEKELKRGDVALVSVMHANNETGVLQPVADIATLAHRYGVLAHTDAVQTAGHMDVQPDALGVDLLTLTAHKFGGPKGAGALVVKSDIHEKLSAQITGGAQERNRRAGTENVLALAGFGAATRDILSNGAAEQTRCVQLMAQLFETLAVLPVTIVAVAAAKVPHVVQIQLVRMRGEDAVIALDIAGLAASQGSACSSGRVKSSHVLSAMGYDETATGQAVRLSLGWATTADDIAGAAVILKNVLGK